MLKSSLVIIGFLLTGYATEHPLRLSLCEIDYTEQKELLTINLKLFLTDVNEAILFDPNSTELAFCRPNEAANANRLLMEYVNRFFFVKANNERVNLKIKSKRLSGKGENTALWIYFECKQSDPIRSLEIKNAIFTDLFFDQNNIVYLDIDGVNKSLMLNKRTQIYELIF